jgi:phosphoglycerate dehydrogenase-like enzyme
VNADVLNAMERGAFLVNVSRGNVIVREDLEEALRARRLGGVGLDVFWEEPPSPEDPLLFLPEVIATPHLGGVTREAHEGIARFVLENLNRVARGEEPLSRVTD